MLTRQMPRPVLVVGEALIDIIDSSERTIARPGGSPANVAIGLSRLGVPVELLTALADDSHGSIVTAWLHESGVRVAPGSQTLDRTSVARAALDANGAARYEFELTWSLPPSGDSDVTNRPLLHIGSLAIYLEPGANEVAHIAERGARVGIPITVDANARPHLIGDSPRARRKFEEIASHATVVKLSDEDAEFLYPGSSNEAVTQRLLDLDAGVRIVALTLGSRGARLQCDEQVIHIEAPKVRVADTIGAGDSFMSGMISRLLTFDHESWTDPATLQAVGEFAVRCAAITVEREGANPPRSQDVK